MIIRKVIAIIFILVAISGCSRFEWEKVPLYDDIFVPEEEGLENPARRPPPYNHQQEMKNND
jgi:hypothetical protein